MSVVCLTANWYDISKAMNTCEELEPRLAAYALGEEELTESDLAHIAICEQCRAALADYRVVAQHIALDAPQSAPSPDLRRRIIAATNPVPQTPLRPGTAPPAQMRRALNRWPALAAALALAVIALLGWNIALQNDLNARQAQLAQSRANWIIAADILSDRQVDAHHMAAGAAQASFWVRPGSDVGCLMASRLPELEQNQVYQVWLIRGNEKIGAGEFVPRDGRAWMMAQSPEPMQSFTAMAVTIEPTGGSLTPTGPVVLEGDLTASAPPDQLARQEALLALASFR
jgi:anti-sigma-K factor RskA